MISSYTFLGPAFGKTMQAERDVYADFLDEAAAVLNLPALNGAASHYRAAGGAWEALLDALLPADAPMLGEVREHIDLKTSLFVEKGATELDRIIACNERIEALKVAAETDFPLSEAEIADLRAEIKRKVDSVHEAEAEAVGALKAAIGSK